MINKLLELLVQVYVSRFRQSRVILDSVETSNLMEGETVASACAIAGTMRRALRAFSDAREQKKTCPEHILSIKDLTEAV
jgi:hypothetical protein